MKKIIPKNIFTSEQFKIADRFGKMYMRLLQPDDFQLSDRDENYFQLLCSAHQLLSIGKPRQEITRMVMGLHGGLWRNQADAVIKDAERLFANYSSVNKTLLRGIQREKLLYLADLVEKRFLIGKTEDGTFLTAVETVRKLWSDIAKYEQLDKVIETPEPDDSGDIQFTDESININDYGENS
jgi:hypothetical protein